jgi:serine phosphatase RsbU (regulator of sigma subunit)
MKSEQSLIDRLTTLNKITETLNRTVDVQSVLQETLVRLLELMALETGWIFLRDEMAQERWHGRGYTLAASHNLPLALALANADAWDGGCDCQGLCNKGRLTEAYNEVTCSRLAGAPGERGGLQVHASAPICAGERVLGILNVAAPDWNAFNPESLALLTNVGSQMGIALERARLYDMMQERRLHEQAALLSLSNRLLRRPELDNMICCLVDEVRKLLDVDACALLLPSDDPDYLVFRAAEGWYADPVAEQRRIPASDGSGSGWVMNRQQSLIMDENHPGEVHLQDSETMTWLEAENFKAAAIVPLVSDGRSIGALVVDSRRPRTFTPDDLRFLQLMANQAAIAIERARLYQEEIQRQRLEEELAVGRHIQLSLLPEGKPDVPGWEFAAVYQAARQVGGDFYDFFELPPAEKNGHAPDPDREKAPRLGLVIADVADKGIPAALFMAMSRTMIRMTALGGRPPAWALKRANKLILKDSQTDLFLSAFYGALDTGSGRLTYANAGHNPPFWYQASTGEFAKLKPTGMVLGVLEDILLTEREITVAPGDYLVFYTDGVTEAMTLDYQEFGEERMQTALAAHANHGAEELLWAIVDAVNTFTINAPQSDDFTLFVLKRR